MADTSDIKEQHPLYATYVEEWIKMRDCYEGERAVKTKGIEYLPPTRGMELDGMGGTKQGQKDYDAYKTRAVFHSFISDAVEVMLGFMHQQPPTIELPPELEDLRERATIYGESIELLLRRINEQQLVTGRIGLFADLPSRPKPGPMVPYIVTYDTERIINWDDGTEGDDQLSNLNLVVLNETGPVRGINFKWYEVEQYRVLLLGTLPGNDQAGESVYKVGVYRNPVVNVPTPDNVISTLQFTEEGMVVPILMGQTSKEIPFVFINSKDVVPMPDDPPLLELGNLCLAIYRGEADYRQTLHKQGQDTLVVKGARNRDDGGDGTWRVGSGASIELDADPGADAYYIGISADGIAGQRESLNDDKQAAQAKAGSLLANDTGSSAESGEALNIRVAARTATLIQIAKAGAAGLEQLLRIIARWRGADPDAVKITPSIDFVRGEITGQDLVQLMTAKQLGAPLSRESIHQLLIDRGMTSKTFTEEMAIIDKELDEAGPSGRGTGTGAGGNPEDDEDPLDTPPPVPGDE